jgi:hypothetical protein
MKAIDVTGQRFGRLTVVGIAERGGHQRERALTKAAA